MDLNVLRSVANATAANAVLYVTALEGKPLLDAGFITINPQDRDPNDANKIAAKVTDAGVAKLNSMNGAAAQDHKPAIATFAVQTGGIELPKVARGFKKGVGGGAPSKYPFDSMEIGQFFFVANSAVKNNDAVKTLGSAAGSANQRYAVELPETEEVERAKRGSDHKAIKDPVTGKNVMEKVIVHKKDFKRKYVVRPVEANKEYGAFTAPADGAVVAREK